MSSINPTHATDATACPLCTDTGGHEVYSTPLWRVVRVEDSAFPAFYRLIWQSHVAEFSDLSAADRQACMEAVTGIERALRTALQATKINLATLGNVVPHLHWHVVARFDWDSHFPNPIWGTPLRSLAVPAVQLLALDLAELDERVRQALAELSA
ncbi:HIT family protein [Roseateles sp.]|uniref:HIT family protein n=1 Tax=Roseateles sp. TaxID=1971397 RepID=UPI003BA4EE3D